MNKILYKKWIDIEFTQSGPCSQIKEGTGCWGSDYIHPATFHQWGNSYDEFATGPGNYTTAIIELPDGAIKEVLPTSIKFIK